MCCAYGVVRHAFEYIFETIGGRSLLVPKTIKKTCLYMGFRVLVAAGLTCRYPLSGFADRDPPS